MNLLESKLKGVIPPSCRPNVVTHFQCAHEGIPSRFLTSINLPLPSTSGSFPGHLQAAVAIFFFLPPTGGPSHRAITINLQRAAPCGGRGEGVWPASLFLKKGRF